MTPAFDSFHPAVEFLFFAGAIGTGMFLSHPLYIGLNLLASAVFFLRIKGKKGLRTVGGLLLLWLFLTAFNGLFVQSGDTVLFRWWRGKRIVTQEALCYGATVGAMFVSVLLWFSCYNVLMTGDKFIALFGKLIPSLSLLLCMILRLVPSFEKKLTTVTGVRRCIGKAPSDGTKNEKLRHAADILSVLTSWALEGSVVTADSMKARGYGTGERTNFNIYRRDGRDRLCTAVLLGSLALLLSAAVLGGTKAVFYPRMEIAEQTLRTIPGALGYAIFLFTPSLLQLWEDITWHILRSRI